MRSRRVVHGVGINDVPMPVKGCPYYDRWVGMLRRCYSEKWHIKHPSYVGCKVCDDWHTFSNFKEWMKQQDWEDKCLDKDLFGSGYLYSPESCCFISQELNKFIKTQESYEMAKMIGVHLSKCGKFEARIKLPKYEKLKHIGTFDSEKDAHQAWKAEKLIAAKEIAQKMDDKKISKALESYYEN